MVYGHALIQTAHTNPSSYKIQLGNLVRFMYLNAHTVSAVRQYWNWYFAKNVRRHIWSGKIIRAYSSRIALTLGMNLPYMKILTRMKTKTIPSQVSRW